MAFSFDTLVLAASCLISRARLTFAGRSSHDSKSVISAFAADPISMPWEATQSTSLPGSLHLVT